MLSGVFVLLGLCVSTTNGVKNVTTADCVNACLYDDTSDVMNCTYRGCHATPQEFNDKSIIWSGSDSTMKAFHLDSNTIVNVTSFPEHPQLTTLDLANSGVRTIQYGAFEKLTSLQSLTLAGNSIEELHQEYFKGLKALNYLDLSSNMITEIDDNVFYYHLENLLTLDLKDNGITELTANAFTDLATLQSLHLEGNHMYIIDPHILQGLNNLITLGLQNNFIKTISEHTFASCHALEFLHLENNLIKTMEPQSLLGLDNLRVLDLTGNYLSDVSNIETLTSMTSLEHLILDGNPIIALKPGTLPRNLLKFSLQVSEYQYMHMQYLMLSTYTYIAGNKFLIFWSSCLRSYNHPIDHK